MTCADCTRAEADPWSPRFTSDCLECSARSLAQSPSYFDSSRSASLTPTYRSALQYVYGGNWKQGHERVKHFAGLLEKASFPGVDIDAVHYKRNTPRQGLQHVLKAEAATPDATDRSPTPAASPSVGSMGVWQPADADPPEIQP